MQRKIKTLRQKDFLFQPERRTNQYTQNESIYWAAVIDP